MYTVRYTHCRAVTWSGKGPNSKDSAFRKPFPSLWGGPCLSFHQFSQEFLGSCWALMVSYLRVVKQPHFVQLPPGIMALKKFLLLGRAYSRVPRSGLARRQQKILPGSDRYAEGGRHTGAPPASMGWRSVKSQEKGHTGWKTETKGQGRESGRGGRLGPFRPRRCEAMGKP